ncbi:MAG: hypothetical protein ACR5K9_09690 [Wolbachia sp.]
MKEKPKPTAKDKTKPPVEEKPTLPTEEEAKPPVEEKPRPPTEEEAKPPVEEKPKPTVEEEPKLPAKDETKPSVKNKITPPLTREITTTVANEKKILPLIDKILGSISYKLKVGVDYEITSQIVGAVGITVGGKLSGLKALKMPDATLEVGIRYNF